jgi:glycosyltransferase involved in cell wall biosynthesis
MLLDERDPMPLTDRILAFIPTYRCAPQVVRVLQQFADTDVHRRFAEILVLDNVSPDATVEKAIERARNLALGNVTVARNRVNYGLGGSHKSAFTYAIRNGFTHVMVIHGDDQGTVRDILPVIEASCHHQYDCCLGARFHPDACILGYSRVRVIGNHVFNLLFSLGAGQRLYDLGSGLNLYRTSSLASRYWEKFHDNLMFNYCMILAHVQRKDKMYYFPISWREEDQVSNVKLYSQAKRTLGILAAYIRNRQGFLDLEFRNSRFENYEFDIVANGL